MHPGQTNPNQIIEALVDRITVIAVRTFEVDQLLDAGGLQRFIRVAHHIISTQQTSISSIEFCCELTLQAELISGEKLEQSYGVQVSGQAAFETPVWRINDITDVTVRPEVQNIKTIKNNFESPWVAKFWLIVQVV